MLLGQEGKLSQVLLFILEHHGSMTHYAEMSLFIFV